MRITIAIALAACGSAAPKAVAPTTHVALAPSPAPPPPTTAPEVKPLATCTDGGEFKGAWIGATGVRYCIDTDCWSLGASSKTLTPIAKAVASTKQADDIAVVPFDDEPAPSASPWTAKLDDQHVHAEVCGPDGCAPFLFAHTKYTPDRGQDEVETIDVSATGERVAVVRGAEGLAKMNVEIYERASHKRLGVVRPKMDCARFIAFAGDSAIVQEWDCANQGGPRMIVGPSGKLVARIPGNFSHRDELMRVDGDRWAFTSSSDGNVAIYDVVRGSHGSHMLSQFARFGVAAGSVYGFEGSGRVTIVNSTGTVIATAAPPTCRWTWEAETIGKIHIDMTGPELRKLLGAPRSTSKPDEQQQVVVTYGQGLKIRIQTYVASADPCGGGPGTVEPAKVIAIDVTAPSKLATGAGIAIGATVADLETAYGSHRIAKRSGSSVQVFGNDDDTGGWTFDIADGKVAAIHVEH